MYNARIIADSISPDDVRLTTFEVVFPRFILAEVNTHRMLSRNSASSRAIPTEKIIEGIKKNPFIPEFNKRVKGMGVGEPLSPEEAQEAEQIWRNGMYYAIGSVEKLMEYDIDKSRANRLLEPYMWHTALISATEWENFFALRCAPDAQPEFRRIATMMRDILSESTPRPIDFGEWHLPFVRMAEIYDLGETPDWDLLKKISTSRCARVSYLRHAEAEALENTLRRHDMLKESGHLSPFEHVARPLASDDYECDLGTVKFAPYAAWSGNFRGWKQYRKEIPNEACFKREREAIHS